MSDNIATTSFYRTVSITQNVWETQRELAGEYADKRKQGMGRLARCGHRLRMLVVVAVRVC